VKQRITKNRALADVCPKGGRHLGDNNLTYGRRGDYVRVSLSKSFEAQTYDRLSIKHITDDETVDTWEVDLTDGRFAPTKNLWSNPALQRAGYWWGHDGSWYGYVPINVSDEVQAILEFTEVLEPVTTG
jgi:hypothetical protein